MIYYIVAVIIFMFLLFFAFLFLLKNKIEELEEKVIEQFKIKTNLIPGIYEVTKKYLVKHNEIFEESMILRKKDFSENVFYSTLGERLNTYKLIHNELNFIFRVCNKHNKLNKSGKFLYIRDVIIELSGEIGNNLIIYKKMVKQFNSLIIFKNLTIVGLIFPIKSKINI